MEKVLDNLSQMSTTMFRIEFQARTCKTHPTNCDLFAFGGRTGAVEIYSASTFKLHLSLKNSADNNDPDNDDVAQTELAMIVGLCFSADGKKFFVANRNGYTRIYDLTGTSVPRPKLLRLHNYKSDGEFLTVLLKDNHLLTSYKDGLAALHSFDENSVLKALSPPMSIPGGVKALSFIPASWPFCTNDHTILLVSPDGGCYFRDNDTIPDCTHEAFFFTDSKPEEIRVSPSIFESEMSSITPTSFVMTGDGFVRNFNMTAYFNNPKAFNLENHSSLFTRPSVKFGKAVYTRSGVVLYVAADDGNAYLFSLRDGILQHDDTIKLHKDPLVDIDLTCNDSYLIAVSLGGCVIEKILPTPTYGSHAAGAYEFNYNIGTG